MKDWLAARRSKPAAQQGLKSALERDDIETWGRLCLEANRRLALAPDPWEAWKYAVSVGSTLRERITIGRKIKVLAEKQVNLYPYQIRQTVTMTYDNAPVSAARQHRLGALVDIHDPQTRRLLAKFRVEQTDEYQVSGIVTEVF